MRTMTVDDGRQELIAWKCGNEDFDFGTILVVHEAQRAVFFRDGQAVEVLGPGQHVLETTNYPFLKRFLLKTFGRKYFHAEVYFVSQSVHMAMQWGTAQPVKVLMPMQNGRMLPLAVGCGGTMNLQADPDQAIKLLTFLLGTGRELTEEMLRGQFVSMMNTSVKNHLANVIAAQGLTPFELDMHLKEMSLALREKLAPEFGEYGIVLREFYVDRFALPENDPAFQQARLLYTKAYTQQNELDLQWEKELKEAQIAAEVAKIRAGQTLTEATAASQAAAVAAQGEAARRSLEGITGIQERQFDLMGKMAEAPAGEGGGAGVMNGLFSDAMRMGLGMQMVREAGGVMKDAMNAGNSLEGLPAFGNVPATEAQGEWTCQCGAVNPDRNKFCGGCGAKRETVTEWICSCGSRNPPANRFCGGCGRMRGGES